MGIFETNSGGGGGFTWTTSSASKSSDTGVFTLATETPTDNATTVYDGIIKVDGKDGQGVHYGTKFKFEATASKRSGTIEDQNIDAQVQSVDGDIPFFREDHLSLSTSTGDLNIEANAIPTLAPRRYVASSGEFLDWPYCSGTVDNNYEPHAVGRQVSDGNLGHVWYSSGTRNTEEVVATAVNNSGDGSADITVDGNNDLHVAWIDDTPDLKYVTKTSGTWDTVETITTTVSSTEAGNLAVQIKLDGNDVPWVCWNDNGTLKVADRTGGSWSVNTSGPTDLNTGNFRGLSMHVESSSLAGFVYLDGNDNISWAKLDSGTWSSDQIETTRYYSTDISYDGSNWGIVAADAGTRLHFISGTSGSWSTEEMSDAEDGAYDWQVMDNVAIGWNGSEWILGGTVQDGFDLSNHFITYIGTSGSFSKIANPIKVNLIKNNDSSSPTTIASVSNGNICLFWPGEANSGADVEVFATLRTQDQSVTYDFDISYRAV